MMKKIINFRFDNSFFVHVYGRNKNILVLGKGSTQGYKAT